MASGNILIKGKLEEWKELLASGIIFFLKKVIGLFEVSGLAYVMCPTSLLTLTNLASSWLSTTPCDKMTSEMSSQFPCRTHTLQLDTLQLRQGLN